MGERLTGAGGDKPLEDLFQGIRDVVSRTGGEGRSTASPAAQIGIGVDYAAFAKMMVKARTRIGHFINSKLFTDPAFDILLTLFAAGEEGKEVAVSECAYIADIPGTTGLRWVDLLVAEGLIERYPDTDDRRRIWVRLTPHARTAIGKYLGAISSTPLRR